MNGAPEVLAGRYELLEVLGRGGMGVVYRARDRMLERTVAVKILPAEFAQEQTLIERFERESRAAARLSNPNIVAVYDTGRDNSVHYFVMEYVPGHSLSEMMRERGRLPVAEAVGLAAQMANGLAAAHGAGIIHRDIKPGNVMVDPSGTAKLLDFGIARLSADAALTRTTTLLGSAPYMAPEVALGRAADERSDVYSLGCVLYEMLTGRPPFVADLPVAVMNQHTSAPPQPPRQLRPEIPAALNILVLQMLAKEPEERPAPAGVLVKSLPEALTPGAEIPTAATALMAAPPPVSEEPPPPPIPRPRLPPPDSPAFRRGSAAMAALIIAVLLGAAIALALSLGSGGQSSTSSPSSSSSTTTPSSSSSTATSTPTQSSSSTSSTTHSTTTSTTTPTTSTAKSSTTSTGNTTKP